MHLIHQRERRFSLKYSVNLVWQPSEHHAHRAAAAHPFARWEWQSSARIQVPARERVAVFVEYVQPRIGAGAERRDREKARSAPRLAMVPRRAIWPVPGSMAKVAMLSWPRLEAYRCRPSRAIWMPAARLRPTCVSGRQLAIWNGVSAPVAASSVQAVTVLSSSFTTYTQGW